MLYQDLENSRLDVHSHKCKRCDFATHSEGHLRQHTVINPNIKDSKQNIILGYEIDMQKHRSVLEHMDEGHEKFNCEPCSFKTHSEGKLVMHKLSNCDVSIVFEPLLLWIK